jgi:Kef-type K+ transport system membrane component KefB
MDQVWFVAALWLLLALVAVLVANWLRISTALSEIVIGTVAQLAIGAFMGSEALGAKATWITFLAGTGAIVLTFLAGAELDPAVFRAKWKESSAVGLVGFFAHSLERQWSLTTSSGGDGGQAGSLEWPFPQRQWR